MRGRAAVGIAHIAKEAALAPHGSITRPSEARPCIRGVSGVARPITYGLLPTSLTLRPLFRAAAPAARSSRRFRASSGGRQHPA